MIEVVAVEDLRPGDIVILEWHEENQLAIIEIERIDGGLILSPALGNLDYSPENPDQIIRIGTADKQPMMIPLTEKMAFAFNDFWQKRIQQ